MKIRTLCQMCGETEAKLRDFHFKVVPGPHWQHGHLHSVASNIEQCSSSMQFNGADGSGKHTRTTSAPSDPGSLMLSPRLPTGDSAQRSGRICCDPSAESGDETWGGSGVKRC